jgi:hypothetical protein
MVLKLEINSCRGRMARRLSDLSHELKSAGRCHNYLHLTVPWIRFFS